MSCGKLVVWSIVSQKGTNILFFYIFEYGAEYYFIQQDNILNNKYLYIRKNHFFLTIAEHTIRTIIQKIAS